VLLVIPPQTEHLSPVSISAAPLSLSVAVTGSTARSAVIPVAPDPLLVRAGDRVHLWSASTNVRLEIEAVSLDYGRAGQVIHLRRLANARVQTAMLAGLVDGADSAELLP
jgi:flagella basal body P-ring formation protein FlgA